MGGTVYSNLWLKWFGLSLSFETEYKFHSGIITLCEWSGGACQFPHECLWLCELSLCSLNGSISLLLLTPADKWIRCWSKGGEAWIKNQNHKVFSSSGRSWWKCKFICSKIWSKHKKIQTITYLTQTHSMQIFWELPLIKPQNDT